MAALSAVRTAKGPLATFHQRLTSAGKPFKVAHHCGDAEDADHPQRDGPRQ